MHIKHWTLLQKLRCLQRVDDASDILFIIGGDVDFFVTNFAKLRLDTAAFLPNRLAEFMGKGWIKSNNEQVVEFSPMGSGVAWRRLDAPPPDALGSMQVRSSSASRRSPCASPLLLPFSSVAHQTCHS
jgi:hypothetical protein